MNDCFQISGNTWVESDKLNDNGSSKEWTHFFINMLGIPSGPSPPLSSRSLTALTISLLFILKGGGGGMII